VITPREQHHRLPATRIEVSLTLESGEVRLSDLDGGLGFLELGATGDAIVGQVPDASELCRRALEVCFAGTNLSVELGASRIERKVLRRTDHRREVEERRAPLYLGSERQSRSNDDATGDRRHHDAIVLRPGDHTPVPDPIVRQIPNSGRGDLETQGRAVSVGEHDRAIGLKPARDGGMHRCRFLIGLAFRSRSTSSDEQQGDAHSHDPDLRQTS
jgi:hypothetical protein